MKVTLLGGIKKPLLIDTKEATSLIIAKDDGTPVVLFKFLPDGNGYVRYTKGEDKTFDETARALGFKL
jgi:hypothetical protein